MRRFLLAALLGAAPAGLSAQERFTPERALDVVRVADPAIAPDGSSIVVTRIAANRIADRWERMLWQLDADGGNPRQLAEGHHAAWSPDGKRIAWLADVAGVTQLVVRTLGVGDVTLTVGEQGVRAFRWSPDGRQLAFTRLVPTASPIPLASPIPAEGGGWAGDPTIVTRLRAEEGWVQLFVVSADGGEARQVTAGGFDVGARDTGTPDAIPFDWSVDGKTLLFDGSLEPDAERRYQQSHIYAVDVATGALQRLTAQDGFWHTPRVSRDGKQVAYLGTPADGASYRIHRLLVMRPDGSGARVLTAALDRDVVGAAWDPDNQTLWFSAQERGTINSWSVSTRDAKVKAGSSGLHRMELGGIAVRGGYGVAIRSTATRPWELVRFPLRKPWEFVPLTRFNEHLVGAVQFGELEELEYRMGDALVHGFLVKPPDFTLAGRYPMHVELHGGPHAMHDAGFSPRVQQLAAAGYLVLLLNPRGSTGYGEVHGSALGERFPGVDLDDVLRGVDEVVSHGWVDTSRIMIGGCGAGGMLAGWVIGRSTRFAAATVRCPGNDWLALSPGPFGAEATSFFERPWRQERIGWMSRSPLQVVGSVQTPTLIIAGDCIRGAPHDEGGEWFAALQLRGIRSALVRLRGECGAAARHPSNALRTTQLMLDWYRTTPETPR